MKAERRPVTCPGDDKGVVDSPFKLGSAEVCPGIDMGGGRRAEAFLSDDAGV